MRNLKRFVFQSICAVLIFTLAPVNARVTLDISGSNFQPMQIAIPQFTGNDARSQSLAMELSNIISKDLESSGLFRVIPQAAYIQKDANVNEVPRFNDWSVLNVQALAVGMGLYEADGKVCSMARLWDVFAQEMIDGKRFCAVQRDWRRVAHKTADMIYENLTGETGYFDTQIVFVDETGSKKNRVKRLAIMDQDGANLRYLTDGSDLVLTPRYSPASQKVVYLSLQNKKSRIIVKDLVSGGTDVIANFEGMSFAPSFSPDGNKIALSLESGGNSDIYQFDVRTRQYTRLTNAPGIDTSPNYSPDGSQIVFNSDRGGSQQLYVMNTNGGNVRRISYSGGRYATPAWSPKGDKIAFTKMGGGKFAIGVMGVDGGGEQTLASSFLDEGPTWAPNGRMLMFFRQQAGAAGYSSLHRVDISGFVSVMKTATPNSASDPSWSPLLP